MTSGERPNPSENPEANPIKDVFFDSEIEDITSGAQVLREPLSAEEAIERGIMGSDAENLAAVIREHLPDDIEFGVFLKLALRDIAERKKLEGEDTLVKFLDECDAHRAIDDGTNSFVPFYFWKSADSDADTPGMTQEEWSLLPQSTKDTLRQVSE